MHFWPWPLPVARPARWSIHKLKRREHRRKRPTPGPLATWPRRTAIAPARSHQRAVTWNEGDSSIGHCEVVTTLLWRASSGERPVHCYRKRSNRNTTLLEPEPGGARPTPSSRRTQTPGSSSTVQGPFTMGPAILRMKASTTTKSERAFPLPPHHHRDRAAPKVACARPRPTSG